MEQAHLGYSAGVYLSRIQGDACAASIICCGCHTYKVLDVGPDPPHRLEKYFAFGDRGEMHHGI